MPAPQAPRTGGRGASTLWLGRNPQLLALCFLCPSWNPPGHPTARLSRGHRTLDSGWNPDNHRFQALWVHHQHSRLAAPLHPELISGCPPLRHPRIASVMSFLDISSQGSFDHTRPPLRALPALPRAQGWRARGGVVATSLVPPPPQPGPSPPLSP